MSTTNTKRLAEWVGHDLVDESGSKIGSIEQIFVDESSGQPEWLTVSTGFFGSKETFVPLRGLSSDGDHLVSPWDKAKVKDAPNADTDEELSEKEQSRLYQHYGLGGGRGTETTSGDGGSSEGASMTRSEEELRVATDTHESERVKLRKWVETDQQTFTVPVRTEKAKLTREPIAGGDTGATIGEADEEIVLSTEEVSLDKQVVAKEKVRLEKEVVVEDEKVQADLKKEHIETEGDVQGQGR